MTQSRIIEPAPDDILPFRACEATLANGLRVIVVPTGFPNLVSLQIPVQTGSRNEVEPGKSGFAHFFEHMMFRGTKRYPAHRYQEIITRAGARQNAYTTDDYTNYHITFASEDLERILEIEADRFMNLEYSEEDFKTEARAILGEYNKNSSDPLNKLLEVQRDHAYTVHTYKHTTMGFLRDIEDMPNQFAYSRTFFERWYRPEYSTVILAGDVDPDRTLALVERYFGPWQRGDFSVQIPQEPPRREPVRCHVEWPAPTLPWLSVAFPGPAFSTTAKDYGALDALLDLFFGETSDLYRELVEEEQKVDQLFPYLPANQDPALATVFARLKDPADAAYVRSRILETVAAARRAPVDRQRLQDAISNARYSFARTLDNSESVASVLARFVRYERSYETLNRFYRTYASLAPEDLFEAATSYLRDEARVEATLAHGPLALDEPAGTGAPVVALRSPSKLLSLKLLFHTGSAYDPEGREGLAALTASMIAEAGSKKLRYDEITRALFPMAGSFRAQVDREMTVFSGVVHADNLARFADIVLPQLLEPGWRETDFTRLREQHRNALAQDLRANNDEELGKERLQSLVFAHTPYGHPTIGTLTGIDSVTLDDVRAFAAQNYTQARLVIGLAGDVPPSFEARLRRDLATLPVGEPAAAPAVMGTTPDGIEVDIIAKETRATALSFGHHLPVTRAHRDFAALWVARSWLGEHRASQGRLFQRLREARGLNYGDYAYIEAFPRGMYQFFPDPNLGRRAQLFEVWVRPVPPEQAVFAFKAALFEVRQLIARGLSPEEFETTREYLAKNVFLLTKTQDQRLGYALDDRWYGIGEFVATMRERLAALTVEEVNRAVREHLSGTDLWAVFVTKDAAALRDELLSGAFTPITYGAAKPADLLEEDRAIGALPLGLREESVHVTPVEQVFS